jgi:MscS family membrane protein
VQRAIDILSELYKGHANTEDVWISFNKFEDSALNILVVHWWNNTDYKAYLDGMQELNLAIKKRFDDEDLDFAFPSQTVYLRQESRKGDL